MQGYNFLQAQKDFEIDSNTNDDIMAKMKEKAVKCFVFFLPFYNSTENIKV